MKPFSLRSLIHMCEDNQAIDKYDNSKILGFVYLNSTSIDIINLKELILFKCVSEVKI